MKLRVKNRLVFRFWIIITLLVLFVGGMSWLFQVLLLEENYVSARKNAVRKKSTEILSILSDQELSEQVKTELNEIAISEGYSLSVFTKSGGEVVYSSISPELRFYRSNLSFVISGWLEKITEGKPFQEVVKEDHPVGRRSFLLSAFPFSDAQGTPLVLVMTSPLSQVQETREVVSGQILWISLLSILIGTLLAGLLARHFSRRILKIREEAEKISRGNFQVQLPETPQDELGDLEHSINEMARQLQRVDSFRNELLSNTSHDLRTPLNNILAYAEILEDLLSPADQQVLHSLGVIQAEASRIGTRVEKILEISRMESGGNVLQLETIELLPFLRDAAEEFRLSASKKQVSLEIRCTDGATLLADRQWLFRALSNLVDNAIKYTQQVPSCVVLEAHASGPSQCCIRVKDQGRGISPGDLPRIWDRFFKADTSRNESGDSPGLGMSIVKSIFEAHGFSYGVESTPGKGSEFWFCGPSRNT
ncbi:MAG TPA: HAMP domain-containing sensor histidine kinase [Thermotogota bacterium]|nr:HAMP domain-containing sensor histidine kinase [Thermotogota bacterium]